MAYVPGRLGSREILDLQIFNYSTGKPIMHFDYANTATQEWTADTVYATGGSGAPRRISWSGNKQSKLTVDTQIFSLQHLALLAGESITNGTKDIYKVEVLQVTSDGSGGKEITLGKTPIGGASAISVFPYENGVIAGDALKISSVTGNKVSIDAAATIAAGAEVQVFYQWQTANASKLSFTSNSFPAYVKLVGDTMYADEMAGEAAAAQYTYYKAKLQPNFTVAMSATGDPASLQLVFDLFPVKVDGKDTIADLAIYEE